ncbi:hypothetical protein R1flu_019364 [Riccia fluitans]|uniref:Uncharacterized protein n=1 Tax=Riccia fluitans TaxID=41844 RepID=A0ABD1ZK03_9MARC
MRPTVDVALRVHGGVANERVRTPLKSGDFAPRIPQGYGDAREFRTVLRDISNRIPTVVQAGRGSLSPVLKKMRKMADSGLAAIADQIIRQAECINKSGGKRASQRPSAALQ